MKINVIFDLCVIIIYLINIIIADNHKSISSSSCYAEGSNNRDPRIVGGKDAEKQEFPYIVSLKFRGGHLCGATIINEKWILTAAHCLCNGFNEQIKTTLLRGVAGLYKISDYTNAEENDQLTPHKPYEFSFKRAIIHPEYKCTTSLSDIALLEIEISFHFNDNIKPICFTKYSKREESYENVIATVIGWGWTDEDRFKGIRSDILQKANVKVWNNEICQISFTKNNKKNVILDTQLCAGYENGGIDSCWADSGGPLIRENKLIGVVSTGIGCARPGLPGIYTRINKYFEWIENVINN